MSAMEYPKIETLFNRDEKTHKVKIGEWRLPEFEYLKDNQWVWTEKIDGTNIRIGWNGEDISIGGRTDNAQIPTFLYEKLNQIFTTNKMREAFIQNISNDPVVLFGEGYGAKIQKGGGNYKPDGVDFILFDVLIGEWWLRFEDVQIIANKLGIESVPIIGGGELMQAVDAISKHIPSKIGTALMEGFVLRPLVDLKARNGHRIIAKIKTKDF